jgi:hypothetical protein
MGDLFMTRNGGASSGILATISEMFALDLNRIALAWKSNYNENKH